MNCFKRKILFLIQPNSKELPLLCNTSSRNTNSLNQKICDKPQYKYFLQITILLSMLITIFSLPLFTFAEFHPEVFYTQPTLVYIGYW